ncbi:hypothetical protein D3C78_777420 [compost metagenome]
MHRAPPFSGRFICKIRENAWARPHIADILISVRSLAKTTFIYPLIIYLVSILNLYPGVHDRDDTKTELLQFLHHACRIREFFLIKCKHLIFAHIMNIQVNNVTRNTLGSAIASKRNDLLLIHITESGLLVAERPKRRKRHFTR